jgi:uncharacterized membrane protein YgdD (TMEM256/DUF423 family)
MYKPAITTGALLGALAVILGAFGAHALKMILAPDMLQTFETAVKYQFYHSLALVMTGLIYGFKQEKPVKLAATFFIIGIVLFSGSLYALVALKQTMKVGFAGLGALTPIGGLFFILGWLSMFWGVAKR